MFWRTIIVILLILQTTIASNAETWTKILNSPFYSTLANTQNGLFAGELDSRLQLNPYNGLISSQDLGETWQNKGLQGRGITDIYSENGTLYAATYYKLSSENGLFMSTTNGSTWNHAGPNFSASAVRAKGEYIFLGGYSNGLWVSKDGGITFTQKLGTGWFGPKVLAIEVLNNKVVVGTVGKTYISDDQGETWEEINYLSGKQIKHILITNAHIFAGTYDIDGLYRSSDGGKTWQRLESFGLATTGAITMYGDTLYAGKYDSTLNTYSIFSSNDFGLTWDNTELNLVSPNDVAQDLVNVYTPSGLIIGSFANQGIYKMQIPIKFFETEKFLDIPWDTIDTTDLIDKISTFFDHSYPLLGYTGITEPSEYAGTTTNFLGISAPQPEMYYSSHSGIDFALPYNTAIKAPADGNASYYYCGDCGHTIKIDHLNGYQTIYMHLKKDNLITLGNNFPILKGDTIGHVGLTGRTTGPHLHFEVIKDSNLNNSFSDEFPHGRVDPFGWLDLDNKDPWDAHFWIDAFGQHSGQKSKYLWSVDIPQTQELIKIPNDKRIDIDNKTFDLQSISTPMPLTLKYVTYSHPHNIPDNLKYIFNTSFLLELFDTLNNKITNPENFITISIKLDSDKLTNISVETLKIHFYDPVGQQWVPLDTSIDLINLTVSANTQHLSHFALFAEMMDKTPPDTMLDIEGDFDNNWYVSAPTIRLTSTAEDLTTILYSFNGGDTWEEYIEPISLTQTGVYKLLYRSLDENNNLENIHEKIINVNIDNAWRKTLRIKGTIFTTQ